MEMICAQGSAPDPGCLLGACRVPAGIRHPIPGACWLPADACRHPAADPGCLLGACRMPAGCLQASRHPIPGACRCAGTRPAGTRFREPARQICTGAWVPATLEALPSVQQCFEIGRHPGTHADFSSGLTKSGACRSGACKAAGTRNRVPAGLQAPCRHPAGTQQAPGVGCRVPAGTGRHPAGTRDGAPGACRHPAGTQQAPGIRDRVPAGTLQAPGRHPGSGAGCLQAPAGTRRKPERPSVQKAPKEARRCRRPRWVK